MLGFARLHTHLIGNVPADVKTFSFPEPLVPSQPAGPGHEEKWL